MHKETRLALGKKHKSRTRQPLSQLCWQLSEQFIALHRGAYLTFAGREDVFLFFVCAVGEYAYDYAFEYAFEYGFEFEYEFEYEYVYEFEYEYEYE